MTENTKSTGGPAGQSMTGFSPRPAQEIDLADASPEERRALYREAFQIANLGGRAFRQDRLSKVLDTEQESGL